ncbi:hypothetical protein CPC08DRAFT_712435 [Agrocybe pediades]|nr:hypothetical protein CPC08DRAFT_712435 [Agrocybe pediades]
MVSWRPPTLILLYALSQWILYANAVANPDSYPAFDEIWSLRESNLIRQQQKKHALVARQLNGAFEPTDLNGNKIPAYNTRYYFDQLIDHDDPSKGTFKQRFWYTWEFYKPGGPIVLTTPGESNAGLYPSYDLTNSSMSGALAQTLNGAVISIEHRFFGESNPYPDLLPDHLKVHTIAQAIQDLAYFAQNVKLALPGGDTDAIRPHKTPWILIGGSYPGALVSWTMLKQPGVFWAGYSTAGVVQPIADFWQYFEPIRVNMPKNCSADVGRVIDHLDSLIAAGNFTAVSELQSVFQLTRAGPLSNFLAWMSVALREWRSLTVTTSRMSLFYPFCDSLEVKDDGEIAPEDGWGLDQAIAGWAKFHRESSVLAAINGNQVDSETAAADSDTVDGELSTQEDKAHSDMSWYWMVCNEVGWVQKGPPLDYTGPTIVSRNIEISDTESLCKRRFPGAFTTSTLAERDGKADRVFVVNGKRDAWLESTLSATQQNIASTDSRPIYLTDGFHCSDLSMASRFFDDSVRDVQDKAFATMKAWVAEFKPQEDAVQVQPIATSSIVPMQSDTPSSSKPSGASRLKVTAVGGFISFIVGFYVLL